MTRQNAEDWRLSDISLSDAAAPAFSSELFSFLPQTVTRLGAVNLGQLTNSTNHINRTILCTLIYLRLLSISVPSMCLPQYLVFLHRSYTAHLLYGKVLLSFLRL